MQDTNFLLRFQEAIDEYIRENEFNAWGILNVVMDLLIEEVSQNNHKAFDIGYENLKNIVKSIADEYARQQTINGWDILNGIQDVLIDILHEQQRERRTLKLSEQFNQLLQQTTLPEAERQRIHKRIMAEIELAVEEASKPALPDKAPELWKSSGQGEKSLLFLQRVYKPWLEARVLTYQWLNEHDPSLVKALKPAVHRLKDRSNILLPLTESELLDMEDKRNTRIYGEDKVEEICRTRNSLKQRESRHKEKAEQEASTLHI
jgi:hypothetical protein